MRTLVTNYRFVKFRLEASARRRSRATFMHFSAHFYAALVKQSWLIYSSKRRPVSNIYQKKKIFIRNKSLFNIFWTNICCYFCFIYWIVIGKSRLWTEIIIFLFSLTKFSTFQFRLTILDLTHLQFVQTISIIG